MNSGRVAKKQAPLPPSAPDAIGEAGVGRARALPSRVRGVTPVSHTRSAAAARAGVAKLTAPPAGRPPVFPADKLPPSVPALSAPSRTPAPPPLSRGPGRPRHEPRRGLAPELGSAQVDKPRETGRGGEVRRRLLCGPSAGSTEILGDQQSTPSARARDPLPSRRSNGRVVRKTLAPAKPDSYLRRPLDGEEAVCKFVRPPLSLSEAVPRPINTRQWQPRTPARAAGLTDPSWSLEELLSYRVPPSGG